MYPSGEDFTDLMSVAFLNALQDANMLMPTNISSGLLLPPDRIKIQLGGDASMTGSKQTITLPLPNTYITIGRPYGTEQGFCGADPNVNVRAYVPFSIWAMTSSTQDDLEKRLLFSRQHRQNVYSTYGLNIIVGNTRVRGKIREESPITGVFVVDYQWEFYYGRA